MFRSIPVALAAISFVTPAALAGTALPWIVWDAPASYGYSATGYDYAGGTTGTMTLADSSVVYVRLTGEVVDPTLGGTVDPAPASPPPAGSYCGPSGFAENGTTISNFWSQIPGTDNGNAFLSANVPTVPTNGDHIGLIGGDGGIQTQTIEFFSDAAMTTATSVSDIVMLVGSLGSGGVQASWTFNQDFTVLSDNSSIESGLAKTNPTAGSYVLSGTEGSGAIQFSGEVSSFTWTVSAPEFWAFWNLGGTASSTSAPAVPGVGGVAALAGVGLAGRRRRR